MIKKKLFITLIILLSFGGHSVAQQQSLYDPYFKEALPATAPEWMRPIAENPSGVNFHEMQRLFNEWKAADVNVRVKTVENKPAVNFYRRWIDRKSVV